MRPHRRFSSVAVSVALVVPLLAGCGGAAVDGSASTGAARSAPTGTADAEAAVRSDAGSGTRGDRERDASIAFEETFQSPTRDVRCGLRGDRLLCAALVDRTTAVLVAGAGVRLTGEAPPPPGPVVPYGSQWTGGGFTCLSTTDGLACTDDTTHAGFVVNRDGVGDVGVAYETLVAP